MNDFHQATAIVVGAGALGSAIAFSLARAGARVTVVDPQPLAGNASGIAAGMIAPAFESALDPASARHFGLLATARDLWPEFSEALHTTGFERCGALLKAPPADLDRIEAALHRASAAVERVGDAIFTPEDWRIEPRLTLAALRRGLSLRQGEVVADRVTHVSARSVGLAGGGRLEADIVVLACGFGGLELAPELAVLSPIKGQILRFPDAGLVDGPILRSLLGYVVPGREGAVAGATMEEGLSDTNLSRDALDRLRVEGAWLSPGLGLARANGFAGVRAATPDGLPLLGRSMTGVYLAAGARRNGWLYAPFAAAVVGRAILGRSLAEDTPYDPIRFIPPG
jgi:glycine oxidase